MRNASFFHFMKLHYLLTFSIVMERLLFLKNDLWKMLGYYAYECLLMAALIHFKRLGSDTRTISPVLSHSGVFPAPDTTPYSVVSPSFDV